MGRSQRWCRITVLGPHGRVLADSVLCGDGPPDMVLVDALARLALVTRRRGATLRVSEAADAVVELLELAGLPLEVQR